MYMDYRVYANLDDEKLEIMEQAMIDRLMATKRSGVTDLIDFMYDRDYFNAPASKNHHLACKGGLLVHSTGVTVNFVHENKLMGFVPEKSIPFISDVHDICKIKEDGENGHGALSVEMIERFVDLTDVEHDCILYHMGTFGCKECFEFGEYSVQEMNDAIQKNKVVQILAACDMKSTVYEDKIGA